MSSDHSIYSSYEKGMTQQASPTCGLYKVKYQPNEDWDFYVDVEHKPIDLSLTLPHYRARNQPVDHRMSMFVGSGTAPVRVKVCRHYPRSKFYLEVQGGTSDVTIWLPSDFRGQIHHSSKATFSAGFVNRVLGNVRFNEPYTKEDPSEDVVVVCTHGHITFRMWDIQTGAPENCRMEKLKRMFGCTKKSESPEATIDWDFLLED